jgi:hypothetical protein
MTEYKDRMNAGENRVQDLSKKLSRFRKMYRPLSEVEKNYVDAIKDHAAKLEYLFEGLGSSRELSLAMTHLENTVMWGVKDATSKRLHDTETYNEDHLNNILQTVAQITAD